MKPSRHLSRRSFLRALAAALAAAWAPPLSLHAGATVPLRKPIPATGELLPVIGLGTSRTFDVGDDPAALDALAAVLRGFFARGGTLIDSSPMYGRAEAVLGQLLPQVAGRENLFAATKVWTDGAEAGQTQMERSRQLWGVERFDLIQIHNLRDWQIHLRTLRAWKAQGRIRYLGITTSHGRFHRQLEEILRTTPLDFVQFSYNIEARDAEKRLLPLAQDRGMAVLVNRPYQRGSLFRKVKGHPLPAWAAEIDCTSWGQVFLKFIVSHPAVTCVIPATSKLKHLQDNMGAGFGRLPDAALRQRMADHFAAL